MKRIISYKLFESAIEDSDKYILNLSSANSIIGVERWLYDSNISDTIKDKAHSWSLYALLSKMTRIPVRVGRLSNKEIAEQIKVRGGVRPMRIREEYDDVCKQLLPQFHKLFNKFKSLPIEKKVEFMIEIEVEGYTICPNGIIKIIDKKDLEEELEVISSIFQYFLLEE